MHGEIDQVFLQFFLVDNGISFPCPFVGAGSTRKWIWYYYCYSSIAKKVPAKRNSKDRTSPCHAIIPTEGTVISHKKHALKKMPKRPLMLFSRGSLAGSKQTTALFFVASRQVSVVLDLGGRWWSGSPAVLRYVLGGEVKEG